MPLPLPLASTHWSPALSTTPNSKRFRPLFLLSFPAPSAPKTLNAAASQASFRGQEEACSSRDHQGVSIGFLSPRLPEASTSPSTFLWEGEVWTRGRCWWFGKLGEQRTASSFLLGEKALDSLDFDGEGRIQQIQGLDFWLGRGYHLGNWPRERTWCKKEATEERILSYFHISWNSYSDTM